MPDTNTQANPGQAPGQGQGAADNPGQAPAGGGQQNNQNPPGLSETQIKQLEGSLYSRFQSDLDKAKNEATSWREKYGQLEQKISSFENIDELEKRYNDLQSGAFEAEAKIARANMIEKDFPQLRSREQFVPLGTEEAMRKSAESLVKEFGLSSDNQQGDAPSLKSGATPPGSSVNLDAIKNMSEEELRETAKSMPLEELKAIMAGAPASPTQSKHSAVLGSLKK